MLDQILYSIHTAYCNSSMKNQPKNTVMYTGVWRRCMDIYSSLNQLFHVFYIPFNTYNVQEHH